MSRLACLSIKRKLIAILMLASSVALLLACSAFVLYELFLYRDSTSREMLTIAQIIAEGTTAALEFSDGQAARDTLQALRAEPRILDAVVYDGAGRVFARHSRSARPGDSPPPRPAGVYFSGGYLEIYHPVAIGRERIGTIYLKSDLSQMYGRLWRYAGIMAVVLAASGLVALLVSSVLQRVISGPVLHLAETAGRVSDDRNYSLRAVKTTQDELGALVDRFNEMMAQIQSRDAELRTARDSLEERVKERTRELEVEIAERRRAQDGLLAAKQAAEESSRAKSAFLANMGHELRTPLNVILGYGEMLEEQAVEAGHLDDSADLKKIVAAGKHLLALINDVLDLSRIEAGKVEAHLESVQVSSLLEDVAGTMQPLAKANGNTFVLRRQTRRDVLYADPPKFRQSLLNLLDNACKFTENGTITLEVASQDVDGVEWMDWRVSDTGVGIAPEQTGKLFQSFSQVDSSVTRKYGGTGLGLAISQKFCQMMGGRITVESELGKGSVFTIRMPVDGLGAQADEDAGEAPRNA